MDRVVRRAAVALFITIGVALSAPTAARAAETTTTILDQGDRSVIPAPNSGRPPEDAGDRGGWAQLTLFGIVLAGSVLIFGRVLWAAHQRSRPHRS